MKTYYGKKIFDIINGPDKGLLFNACRYAYDDKVYVNIKFAVILRNTLEPELMDLQNIKIVGIKYTNNCGEHLCIDGKCTVTGENYNFNAFYDTKKRRGVIKFE